MIRQNPIYETALDEEVAAAAPTLTDTNSIEGVQHAMPSIRDPSPAVSTALEIPTTPPTELTTTATRTTEIAKGPAKRSLFMNVPKWSSHRVDQGTMPKFALETTTASPLTDREHHTQEQKEAPTISIGEQQHQEGGDKEVEESLSSSEAQLPSRQPDSWPSQGLSFTIPESPALETEPACSPRPQGLSHARSPGDDVEYQDDKRFELLKQAIHCSVFNQREGPTGEPEYLCEPRMWLPRDAAHAIPDFVRANRLRSLRTRKRPGEQDATREGTRAGGGKRAKLLAPSL